MLALLDTAAGHGVAIIAVRIRSVLVNCEKLLSFRDAPESYIAIIGHCGKPVAVSGETDIGECLARPDERGQCLPVVHIPEAHASVAGGGCERFSIGRECQCPDCVVVSG